MKHLLIAIAALLLAATASQAGAKPGSHAARSHVTKKGAYVPRHRATNPDHTKRNNWSTKGNVNPYTGKPGTKDPNAPKH
jgi:hypothetical protein